MPLMVGCTVHHAQRGFPAHRLHKCKSQYMKCKPRSTTTLPDEKIHNHGISSVIGLSTTRLSIV